MGTLLAVMKRLFPITPSLAEHLQEVGRNIRVARLRHGISAELVAEFAGISRPTLRAVERGRASVAIGAYARVMEILSLEHTLAAVARDDALDVLWESRKLKVNRRAPRQRVARLRPMRSR